MSKTSKLLETCCQKESDVQPISPREQTSSEVNIISKLTFYRRK